MASADVICGLISALETHPDGLKEHLFQESDDDQNPTVLLSFSLHNAIKSATCEKPLLAEDREPDEVVMRLFELFWKITLDSASNGLTDAKLYDIFKYELFGEAPDDTKCLEVFREYLNRIRGKFSLTAKPSLKVTLTRVDGFSADTIAKIHSDRGSDALTQPRPQNIDNAMKVLAGDVCPDATLKAVLGV